jgi:hypothetical protein
MIRRRTRHLSAAALAVVLLCATGASQILGEPAIFPAPRNGAVAAGDLDRDGHRDLAVTGPTSNVSILLGNGLGGFAAGTTVAVGSQPLDVAIEDVNGDGILDLVTANFASHTVSFARGTGSGTFAVVVSYATGINPVFLTIADVNNDGLRDVLTANQSHTVTVLLGTGNGAFAAPVNYATGTSPRSIGIGDWDSDGALDLAVASSGSNRITLHRGTGIGTFVLPTGIFIGSITPDTIAVADLNRDGRADLVVTNRVFQGEVVVLHGNGSGGFTPLPGVRVGTYPSKVVVGDFNADRRLDVAVAIAGNLPAVLLGDGAGGLGPPIRVSSGPSAGVTSLALGDFQHDGRLDLVTNEGGMFDRVWLYPGIGAPFATAQLLVGTGPSSVAIADMNGDGAGDVVTANRASNSCSVLLNNGTGTFGAAQGFPVGASPAAVALGDFDNDGRPDVMTANSSSSSLSLLRNNGSGALLPPVILGGGPGTGLFALAIVDVDRDGNQDVVWLAATAPHVMVGRGNGAGGFTGATVILPPGSAPTGFALVDFDRDGDQDLVVANASTSTLIRVGNDGSGTFSTHSVVPIGSIGVPNGIAVGDVNGDGRSDVVVTVDGGRVGVLLDDGAGGYQTAMNLDLSAQASMPALADVNRDGLFDLAVTLRDLGSLSVLLGDGAGRFTFGTSFPTAVQAQPSQLAVTDLSGDGAPDIVSANANSIGNTIAVLLGEGLVPFGTGTPGCDGMLGLSGATAARIGRSGFGFTVTNAPRNTAGTLMFATAPDLVGTTILGFKLHVGLVSVVANLPMASDVGGVGFLALPIPANTGVVDARVFAQTLWVEGASGRACSSAFLRLVTSRGVAMTLLP